MVEIRSAAETILAVDDNPDGLYALERMLAHAGYRVLTAVSGKEALDIAKAQKPSLILLDIMMPGMDGLEVTRCLKSDSELRFVPVILLTAKSTLDDVVEGLDEGADGYITKPFRSEELLARLRAALRLRRLYLSLQKSEQQNARMLQELSSRYSEDAIVAGGTKMREILALVDKVAKSDSSVLITGPSGTGKELIARALHYKSSRKAEPFIAKNCAAFSEHLLESELFGHKKGAFTGAVRDHRGLFEAAHRGTLFLDEIAEMPPNLQAKLLRALQEGAIMPVGSTEEQQVDVRILAATNRNLKQCCEEGTFREDLFYRLNVISISLPPLCERAEDIPPLVEFFLSRAAERRGIVPKPLNEEALNLLCQYRWPGNIRELENEIERLYILGVDDESFDVSLLSPPIQQSAAEGARGEVPPEQGTLKQAVERLERELISKILEETGGNKTEAAKRLGISRSNLISKSQLYELG